MTIRILLMKRAWKLMLLRPHRDHPSWDAAEYRWSATVTPGVRDGRVRTSIADAIYPEGTQRWFSA